MDEKNNGDDFSENRAEIENNDVAKIENNDVASKIIKSREDFIINALLQLKALLTSSETNLENLNFEELKTAIYLHILLYACDDRERPTGFDDDYVIGVLFGSTGSDGMDRLKAVRNTIAHGNEGFKIFMNNSITSQRGNFQEIFDSTRLEEICKEFLEKNRENGSELIPYEIILDAISKGKLSSENLNDPTVKLALFDLLTNLLVNYNERMLYQILYPRNGANETSSDSHEFPLLTLLCEMLKRPLSVSDLDLSIIDSYIESLEDDSAVHDLESDSSNSKPPIEILKSIQEGDAIEDYINTFEHNLFDVTMVSTDPHPHADISNSNHVRNSVTHHYRAMSSTDDVIIWDYEKQDKNVLTCWSIIPFIKILEFIKSLDRDKLEDAIGKIMDSTYMNIPHTPVQMPFDDEQIADAITDLKYLNLDLDKYFHGDGEGDGEKGDDGEKNGHDGQDDPR